MASLKPVVIKNGEFQQLQSGDDLIANGLKAFASGGVNFGGTDDPGISGRITVDGASSAIIELHPAGTTTLNTGFSLSVSTVSAYLWLYDNKFLGFATNNAERMRLTATGGLNLGGTTDPGAGNLSLNGGTVFLTASSLATIRFSITGSFGAEAAQIQVGALSGAWNSSYLDFLTHTLNTAAFASAMRIMTGVNIGGTTDPGAGNLILNTGGLSLGTVGGSSSAIGFNRNTNNGAIFDSARYAFQLSRTSVDQLVLTIWNGAGTLTNANAFVVSASGGVNIGGTTDPGAGNLAMGIGGTGTNVGLLTINGGSGLGGGSQINLQTNGVANIALGSERTVAGGTGNPQKCVLYAAASLYRLFGMGAGTLQTDTSGNIMNTSDETLKIIEGTFDRGMADLRGLTAKKGHWTEDSGYDTTEQYVWLTAQDLLPRIPEAVFLGMDDKYTVDQGPVLHTVINALNEIDARLARLEGAPKPDKTDRKKLAADRIDGLKQRQIERKKNHRKL